MSELTIDGPAGRLEARFARGMHAAAPVVLILHPHPLFGGTLNNKVVFALHRAFRRHGFATLRLNFRGVGHSQGSYGDGDGEVADALAALDWLQRQAPQARQCWLAGYSFGAWITLRALLKRPDLDGFVTVAPPVNLFDFDFLDHAPCPVPGLILHGEHDDLVPEPRVAELAHRLARGRDAHIEYRRIDGASHFFEQHMDELARRLDHYLAAGAAWT